MAENEDGQEKKHDPSGQKLDEAAEKGNIAKSQDINSLAILTSGGLTLMFGMPMIARPVLQYCADLYNIQGRQALEMAEFTNLMSRTIETIFYALLLPMSVIVFAGVFAGLAQSWGKLATKAMELDPNKMNPVSGFKSMYMSWMPLVELGKGLGKLIALGGISVWAMWDRAAELPGMATLEPNILVQEMGDLVFTMFLASVPIILIIAFADYSYQKWKHNEDLKMTDQEVKDQAKQQEGDPHMKAMRKSRARQIAMGQMLQSLPEADVIVTNPTHYAVALKYKRGEDMAPMVLAKGIDFLALRIRSEARKLGIAQVEDRPLARALYAKGHINQAIPEEFYGPVARVLAIIYRRRARKQQARGL